MRWTPSIVPKGHDQTVYLERAVPTMLARIGVMQALRCPLWSAFQTQVGHRRMSEKCHKRTWAKRIAPLRLCDGLRIQFMALKQALNFVCRHRFAE
jgi:hypothetical protein